MFFGGGTPSYLPAEHISALTESIAEAFEVSAQAEVTLEANPGDINGAKLVSYQDCGVNRLSIGVQSLDDRLLSLLGRRHTASEAVEAYEMAVDAGFGNISIDLMYGLSHQSLDDWARTLSAAVDLEPDHVSMYCLTLEGGTPMERWVRSGRMPEPEPDLAADMYLLAQDHMKSRSYRHYEISNWAQPGKESRHNLTYWRNRPYLGVGPGAHSYLVGHRFHNLNPPRDYIRKLQVYRREPPAPGDPFAKIVEGVPTVETTEVIGRRLEMAETMMLGLRLDTGIGVKDFAQRFGASLEEVYSEALDELQSTGLLEADDDCMKLTSRGRLLGNEVFTRFFDYANGTT